MMTKNSQPQNDVSPTYLSEVSRTYVRFAFFGTPELAVDILDALEAAGYVPTVVVSMPDRARGRGMEMRESPVATWARGRNIEVLKPEKLDSEFISKLEARSLTLALVVAYGKILPQTALDMMPMYNIHYSLLPRWRGATPVEAAILAGDTETGVAIQQIVYELDAGPIVALEKTIIGADETGIALRTRLNGIAKKLLVRILPEIIAGGMKLVEQDKTSATFCGKISKEDGLLDLSDGGETNYRKFRAYFGWPGVYTFLERNGKKIRTIIVKAHMDGERFVIDTVKPEGKGEMPYADFVRSGAKPSPTL